MSNIIIILYGFVKPRNKFCAVCACVSYKNRQFPLFFAPYRARKSTRRRQSRAPRGARRAGTALSRKNAVHKERTPAKRPPAALFPPRAARGKSLFQERTHARQTTARRALPPRAQRGGNPCFEKERTSVKRPPATPSPPPRALRGEEPSAQKNARAAKGRPCARGGEVQTRAHSSSDLISINFFASSMTLPSKLDGSGS